MKRFLAAFVVAFTMLPAGIAAADKPDKPEKSGPNQGVCNAYFRGSERGQAQKHAHGRAFQRLEAAAEEAGVSVAEYCGFEEPTTPPPDETACEENGLDALLGTELEGVASGVVHESVEPLATGIDPALGTAVHDLNCNVVVAVEEAVDDLLGTNQ